MLPSIVVDVVIIGAGMAGLRAAQVLQTEQQKKNDDPLKILVLEARPVAGGRIRWTTINTPTLKQQQQSNASSASASSLYIDEGAQFIHGSSNPRHPIRKMAQQHGIRFQKIDWDDGYLFVGPNRQELPRGQERKEDKVVQKMKKQLEQWQEKQEHRQRHTVSLNNNGDVSLHSLVEEWIAEHCAKDPNLSAMRLRAAWHMEVCDDYAADLTSLSARFFDQDEEMGGTDAVPHTYQSLVETALAPVQDLVQYETVVQKIIFARSNGGGSGSSNDESLVTISCQQGNEASSESSRNNVQEIKARRVICTLPLGVLKQQSAALFDPPLPEPLSLSIARLGFGCLEKVWLTFAVDQPFWPTDADAFYHAAAVTPYRAWFLPARVYKNLAYRCTLCCFVSGEAARALAHKTTTEVGAEAVAALRQILTVPPGEPSRILAHVHVTQWSVDPWSGHGSYSHMAVGATPDDVRIWEHSCYDRRLWFAGEATHAEYPSTVHGAYLSGERAARACLQSLK